MNKSIFNITLRTRLAVWVMLINTLLLAVLVIAAWFLLRREQDAILNNTLKLSATQLTTAVDAHDGKLIASADEAAILAERGVFGWILDPHGSTQSVIGIVPEGQAPDIGDGLFREHQFSSGEHVRLFRMQLAEVEGNVIVGISTQPLQQTTLRAVLAFALAFPLTLALSGLGGLFVAGRALSPISTITAQAQRISHDNLTERLSLSGPNDEVMQLARTFDSMLDRLQLAFESERRFTADASHELRTPLALLKAQLTLALNRPRDAQTLTQMMQAMDGDVDRMTRLVATLLALARADQPLSKRQWVNIADLIASLIKQLELANAERHIHFALDLKTTSLSPALSASSITVMGDADLLMQLFLNLLDNAVTYLPEQGTVHVTIQLSIEPVAHWQVDIRDNGIGIAPEHLPHLFDRFYRVDGSRARQSGGAGLGLSIAQAIAKQHGGHIAVSSALGLGSTFSVFLPVSVNKVD